MNDERLITGVAAVFAGIAIVLAVTAILTNPVVLFVALAFAASAYLMYDQVSGRMAARVYERVEERGRVDERRSTSRSDGGRQGRSGGFGAGPREPWDPPRDGQSAREAAARQAGARAAASRSRRTAVDRSRPGPTPAERAAYETLGVEPGADTEAVREAYRERVKEVHPDAPSGSKKRFKAVKDAYERLTE